EGRGSDLFEVFALLRQRYPNLEMVVRSAVPAKVKARHEGMANLRIIDQPIPREALEQEYQMADIFVIPTYGTVPYTILEAMSYELPVVTIDSWANTEYVADGKTGLMARRSTRVPAFCANTFQPNFLAADFREAQRVPDPDMVADLASKVALLIESPELRRQQGRAARWEVEHGKFSLARMNEKLGRVFDEAIGQEQASGQVYPTGLPQAR
ncbi:MAG TPA: glycosyltransferase family 4 protein, partial [Dehalococcoidia bacterium]|nr:glycosyltransferase family 4 protein [Dehalococcoidia bacterium]